MNIELHPTAIQTMRLELTKLQAAAVELVTDNGYVRTGTRYRYQEIVRAMATIKQSIDYLEGLYYDRSSYVSCQDRPPRRPLSVARQTPGSPP